MDTEIDIHIKSCDKSQRTRKDKRGSTTFASPIPQCSKPNQRIYMDLFGPLETMQSGKKFILCITYTFSKYKELVAVPNKTTPTVASALFSRWLCRHGLPLKNVSDNGKEFSNEIVDTLLKFMDIKKTNTTTFHPRTNAQAEVCNKTTAAYLKTQVLSSTLDWEQYIAPMRFAYNTSYHRSIKSTPFEVTFGLEPPTAENPNPDLRRLYGENLGKEMYQRLQVCQNVARKKCK
jgi:hypothetical protein